MDVLLVYEDRSLVQAVREVEDWEGSCPPVRIIAMTPLEVSEYDFITTTHAVRLV